MSDASPSRAELLFGTDEEVVPLRRLSAGSLSVDFDRGNLRYVRWGGREVLRAVAFVVRDTQWGTYSPEISDLVVEEGRTRFTVSYTARCDGADGSLAYRTEIEGRNDGTLAFRATARTDTGFNTCRTGFVVMHPLEGVVGRPVEVEHTAGNRSSSVFPENVSPDQPFFNVRSLSHEPWPGVRVTVRMDGDPFEAEDHRNWTDASFKTYVRPLSWGYPYRLEAGAETAQAVTVAIAGRPPLPPAKPDGRTASLRVDAVAGRLPRFGLFLPDDERAATAATASDVAALHPAYVIGRIDLRAADSNSKLAALDELARRLGAPLGLEVVIPGTDPAEELVPLAAALAARTGPLHSVLVVPARDLKTRPANTTPEGEATSDAILAAARRHLRGHRLGSGMTVAFPEFNRNRPARGSDFVAHATQAIIHAADDISVMETLEALPDIIRSTRAMVGNVAYRLGPATIGLPPSASAVTPRAGMQRERLTLAERDPRQRGLFAAAFAVGYAAIAASNEIDEVTLASPTGGSGMFEAATGAAFPIAAAFAGLAALSGMPRLETAVGGSAKIAALGAEAAEGPVIWLANLSAERVAVAVSGRPFTSARTIEAAALAGTPATRVPSLPLAGNALSLDAYAVSCLT